MRSKHSRAAMPRKPSLMSKALLGGSASILMLVCSVAAEPAAAAVEYVKVCSLYGAGFYYIPGTDQCANSNGMPFRVQTQYGTILNTLGSNTQAYGQRAFAYGSQSLALGNDAWAGGDPTSDSPGPGKYGYGGMFPGTAFMNAGSTAVGDNAEAGAGADDQTNSTAVGENALANAKSAAAVGEGSNASGDYSVAYGVASTSSGKGAVAIGYSAQATQAGSIAMGNQASSTGANAIAIGNGAAATGSVAVGNQTFAQTGGAAFGDFASATGSKSVALGYGAVAKGANSVAVGAGSVASGANTFSVGSPNNPRRITNIAPGTSPTDATNIAQFNQGLADTLTKAEDYTNAVVGGADIGDLKRSSFSGIAAVAALDDPGMPSAAGLTRVSVQGSAFENYMGGGISFSHRLDSETPLAIDGGFAHAGGENVGRVGLSVEF